MAGTLTDLARPFVCDFDGTRYLFPIRPQQYEVPWQTRTSYTPTRDGGWEDNYGPHIGGSKVMIAGTFGRGITAANGGADGAEQALLLETTFLAFYKRWMQGSKPRAARFFNLAARHAFEVQINQFTLKHSIPQVLAYQFAIQMTILSLLESGEKATDWLTPNSAVPLQPLQAAATELQDDLTAFRASVETLERSASSSAPQVRIVAGEASDLLTNVSRVALASQQVLGGVVDYMPIERAELRDMARSCRLLAGAYGGLVDDAVLPFESLRSVHRIQRSIQTISIQSDLFTAGAML